MTQHEINSKIPQNSRWLAISDSQLIPVKTNRKISKATFKCSCGKIRFIRLHTVFRGDSQSCGCLQKEVVSKSSKKYSVVNVVIRQAYHSMMARCYNPKTENFYLYGGRGVSVCNEWRGDYESFLQWSLSNGWHKGLQLDKDIKGNGKLYSPNDCLWVTPKENANSRRNCVKHLYEGQYLTLSQICRKEGLKLATIHTRINNGISLDEAIKKPVKRYPTRKK